jgi:hypothetical protein
MYQLMAAFHYAGIALTPPVSRFKSTLDTHLALGSMSSQLPGIQPTSWIYAAKTFKRRRASDEDILILPKTINELPSKQKYTYWLVHVDADLRGDTV